MACLSRFSVIAESALKEHLKLTTDDTVLIMTIIVIALVVIFGMIIAILTLY